MKTKNILLFSVLSLVILSSAAFATPGVPHKFFGTVTINGMPAPDGTAVSANINGVTIVNKTTLEGKYGYSPKTYYVDDPISNRAGNIIQFFVNGVDTGARVNFSNGYSTKLNLAIPPFCDPFQKITNRSWDMYTISPKNQDNRADNFIMTVMLSSNGSFMPFANNTHYNVVFSNQTSVIKNISVSNASMVNISWNGTANGSFVADGEYNISLYLMNAESNETAVFNRGMLVIDNAMDFLVQNSTSAVITPTQNFTFNITFPANTLYFDINGQTRLADPWNMPKVENVSWDGNTLFVSGYAINPCDYDHLSKDVMSTEIIYCGPFNPPTPYPGGNSSCGGGGGASAPISKGYHNLTITAYDDVWNRKTKIISVYVDLRETYFSQTLKQYWNSFFLPRIVLEDVPDMNGNYSVQNILSSLENNYDILYYYNDDTKKWMSYNPNRPLNDLTDFIDNSSKPYWIKMKTNDTLIIK